MVRLYDPVGPEHSEGGRRVAGSRGSKAKSEGQARKESRAYQGVTPALRERIGCAVCSEGQVVALRRPIQRVGSGTGPAVRPLHSSA